MRKRKFESYCDDIENVENYGPAKADNFKGWCCHHRLETHNSDGKRRLVDIARDELKAFGMYWHRPADELIFLTRKEHALLHKPNKGNHHSEEARKKMSEANKGRKRGPCTEETKRKISEARKVEHLSEEWKRKISETLKGRQLSEETRNKMSEAWKGKPKLYLKGKHWKLVDGKRVWY